MREAQSIAADPVTRQVEGRTVNRSPRGHGSTDRVSMEKFRLQTKPPEPLWPNEAVMQQNACWRILETTMQLLMGRTGGLRQPHELYKHWFTTEFLQPLP